jgi:hypothetical protein
MCSPPLGESAEPAFERRKIKSILLLTTLCIRFAHRQTPDRHTKRTRIISVIYSPTRDQTEKNQRTNNHHSHVFLNRNIRVSHPYASPDGHGTTPSAKWQRWSALRPPEPPCGLRPRAIPMILPDQRISGTQKQYQTFKMIPFPRSFTTVSQPPQIQNNAEAQDHTVRRTAAQQRLPINRHTLTRCLNRLPSILEPANFLYSLIR